MTAAAIDTMAGARVGAPDWRTRVWRVVRLHAANPWGTIYLPLTISVGIFGLHFATWVLIARAAGGAQNIEDGALQTTGGMTWVAFYLMSVAIQAMNASFKFAMGFSATRRQYYAGTVAYFALVSLGFAAAITALAAVERATDGWGLDASFFAPLPLAGEPLLTVAACWLFFLLLMFGIGIATGAMYVRWKSNGVWLMFGALGALVIGSAWLITQTDSWSTVGAFFTERPLAEVFAWSLVLTAPALVAGYALLRKATPNE